jgi:hypothetical protein
MIAELLQDLKAEVQEFPEFAAAVLLTIVVGIGFNAAVFRNAIGDEFQVHASQGLSAIEQVEELRAHNCSAELKPGFTVVIGLRKYNVEMSVPLDGVRSLFNDIQTNVSNSLHG